MVETHNQGIFPLTKSPLEVITRPREWPRAKIFGEKSDDNIDKIRRVREIRSQRRPGRVAHDGPPKLSTTIPKPQHNPEIVVRLLGDPESNWSANQVNSTHGESFQNPKFTLPYKNLHR